MPVGPPMMMPRSLRQLGHHHFSFFCSSGTGSRRTHTYMERKTRRRGNTGIKGCFTGSVSQGVVRQTGAYWRRHARAACGDHRPVHCDAERAHPHPLPVHNERGNTASAPCPNRVPQQAHAEEAAVACSTQDGTHRGFRREIDAGQVEPFAMGAHGILAPDHGLARDLAPAAANRAWWRMVRRDS